MSRKAGIWMCLLVLIICTIVAIYTVYTTDIWLPLLVGGCVGSIYVLLEMFPEMNFIARIDNRPALKYLLPPHLIYLFIFAIPANVIYTSYLNHQSLLSFQYCSGYGCIMALSGIMRCRFCFPNRSTEN